MSVVAEASAMSSQRGELKTLQAGRGLAAVAVVLYHASLTLALPKYLDVPVASWALAGSAGVHFFFVLSGVIITLAHLGQINTPAKVPAFLWRRFRRIYPPLWAACALSILGMILVGGKLPNAWTLFSAFAVTPAERETVLAVEWTLRHEIIFYILFSVLILNARLGGLLIAMWCLASLSGFFIDFQFPLSFWFSPYHILFLLGVGSAFAVRRDVPCPGLLASLGTLIFLAGWIGVVIAGEETDHPLAIAVFGLGAAIAIVGFAKLERLGRVRVWRWLEHLGDASYSIYLTHFLIISLLAKIVLRADAIMHVPALGWFFSVSALSLLVGICFYYSVERPLLRILPANIGKKRA